MRKLIKEMISPSRVHVGEFTYGHEQIILNWCDDSSVEIGKYCSIAANVTIQCGGNHRSEWITTFPFGHDSGTSGQINPVKGHPKKSRGVVIGNDVWIGNNVTIMGGTQIGDGAIIGMNSHVFGEIPAYSIFAGNPAKLVRYRFDPDMIEDLLNLNWWTYPHERILKAASKLCQEPTKISIAEIKVILEK